MATTRSVSVRASACVAIGRVCRIAAVLAVSAGPAAAGQGDTSLADRFGQLALDCVHQEYPNKIAHVLNDDGDARPPRELTPAFFGCYDWHSSVHGHWLLARVARLFPESPSAGLARSALSRSLTMSNIAQEVRYMRAPGRSGFERPYGVAWLLQLAAELREWDDPDARRWRAALVPLENAAALQIKEWLPNLTYPIRVGEHSQTAFAFGLILDWAHIAGDTEMLELIDSRIGDYYSGDRACPLSYEPSGHDFLSPCLAEADLMRRVVVADRFALWLRELLPDIPEDGDPSNWIEPAVVIDASDGKLAHLDGLNLSRAWMLEGIAGALAAGDARRPALLAAAAEHRAAGLAAVTGEHYEGGHWLGTFATYLVTERGLR
ncbi:MAG: hypothetical protein CL477_06805 [Acidobacteria bacterium]|jgi:hypothetical protein|nr:hypothetical protein [Acidobacteriota bacterium]HJN45844.1 DUF2891 domain-containing protein [Vicinamibacterales bacterium]